MSPASPSEAKSRASFTSKLHRLLSAEAHPEYLHWLSNDSFAITSIDAHARVALAPQWDFRSLSSFVRQLSYYSFKRLSDRRRSAERRSSLPAFIVFTHPSGNFVRDDEAKAALIVRKLRARKSTAKRKQSTASSTATGGELDYGDRSPSPGAEQDLYEQAEDVKPNITQLGLAGYQLAPWNAVAAQDHAIRSDPCPIPGDVPPHLAIPLHGLREGASHSPFEPSYPSPMSAPSPHVFYRAGAAQAGYYAAAQPVAHSSPEQAYYYPPAPVQAPYASYAPDRLPPLHAVTGHIAPPSPPPEHYVHHPHSQEHVSQVHFAPPRQPHGHDDEKTPSPLLIRSAPPPASHPGLRYPASSQAWDVLAATHLAVTHAGLQAHAQQWTPRRAAFEQMHVQPQPQGHDQAQYAEQSMLAPHPHASVVAHEHAHAYADELEQHREADYAENGGGAHYAVAAHA
ncbi:hypothetical protein JCM10449v2_004120 [Rhodotorula kratochvilovae]